MIANYNSIMFIMIDCISKATFPHPIICVEKVTRKTYIVMVLLYILSVLSFCVVYHALHETKDYRYYICLECWYQWLGLYKAIGHVVFITWHTSDHNRLHELGHRKQILTPIHIVIHIHLMNRAIVRSLIMNTCQEKH